MEHWLVLTRIDCLTICEIFFHSEKINDINVQLSNYKNVFDKAMNRFRIRITVSRIDCSWSDVTCIIENTKFLKAFNPSYD